jgi:hypothetical protein
MFSDRKVHLFQVKKSKENPCMRMFSLEIERKEETDEQTNNKNDQPAIYLP